MRHFALPLILCGALALMLLGASTYAQAQQNATAELKNASGQVIGTATFTTQAGVVRVTGQFRNLPPGQHGIHIHAVGKCDPPDFMSAGGHFNPENKQHGLQNPSGAHAGDMPNLIIGQDGSGGYDGTNTRVTLEAGANSLLQAANGTALVIHANADDQVTDPTGNSGGRIACGVIMAQAATTQLPRTGDLPTALPLIAGAAILAGCGLLIRRYSMRTNS